MANNNIRHVNVYYVGGLSNPKAIVSAKGMSFRVPAPGEYLNVPYYIANDLVRRNKMPNGASVFTTNGELVKRMMAESKASSSQEPQKFSREQLLAMLNDLDENIQEDLQEGARAARKSANAKKVEEA